MFMQVSVTGIASGLNVEEVHGRVTEEIWLTSISNVYCCELSGSRKKNETVSLFIGSPVFGDVLFYSRDPFGNFSELTEVDLELLGQAIVAAVIEQLNNSSINQGALDTRSRPRRAS